MCVRLERDRLLEVAQHFEELKDPHSSVTLRFIGEIRAETEVQSDKGYWRHDSDVQYPFRSEYA